MTTSTHVGVGAGLTETAAAKTASPSRSWLLTSVAVLVLATTAACGGGGKPEVPAAPAQSHPSSSSSSSAPSPESAAPAEESAEEVIITISDFAFDVPKSISPGAEVTVVNEDSSYHTVTSDDGTFDVGARRGGPVTFTAPDKPGEYPFHCTPHPNMTATLVVA